MSSLIRPVECRRQALKQRHRALVFTSPFYLQQPRVQPLVQRLRELVDLRIATFDPKTAVSMVREHEIYISAPGLPPSGFPVDELACDPGNLKYIACIHGGVRGIVNEAILQRGILVTNWHDATAVSIGSHALSLLIAVMCEFRAQTHHVENGGWRLQPDIWRPDDHYAEANRVYGGSFDGLKVGVYGLGHAGRQFAQYAMGLNWQVQAFDPYATDWPQRVQRVHDLDALCDGVHALVITAALTPQTRGSITARHFASLPDGAIVVNVARGEIVDQEAMFKELLTGRLRAGLDVLHPDWLDEDHPVRFLRNVLLTCHGRPENRLNPPQLQRSEVNCLENVRRYVANEALLGVIDLDTFGRMS